MTRSAFVIISISLATAIPSIAQRPLRTSQPDPDRYTTTIEGCVRGARLIPARGVSRAQSSLIAIAEYQLRGSRADMRALRDDHEGHREEITGVVEVPREPQMRTGAVTKDLGKGRVSIATRQNRSITETDSAQRPATLTVSSVRHLASSCVEP